MAKGLLALGMVISPVVLFVLAMRDDVNRQEIQRGYIYECRDPRDGEVITFRHSQIKSAYLLNIRKTNALYNVLLPDGDIKIITSHYKCAVTNK